MHGCCLGAVRALPGLCLLAPGWSRPAFRAQLGTDAVPRCVRCVPSLPRLFLSFLQAADFHKDLAGLSEAVLPRNGARLAAEESAAKHYGEHSCRDFREAVLAAMPHRWGGGVASVFARVLAKHT